MNLKPVLYWLSRRSILVIAILLLGLGAIFAYFLATGFSPQQSQAVIGVAAISAFLAAISATANLLQAVEAQRQRELLQRPYVIAYFDGSSKATVNFLVQNSGNSPARNVTILFEPSPVDFAGRTLDKVSVFSKPISFLPAGATIRQLVDVGHRLLADGKPTHFVVSVTYSSVEGQSYSERFDHDIEWMKQATVPEKSLQDHLSDISEHLKKMAG